MLHASLLCLVVGIPDGNTLTVRCGALPVDEPVTVRLIAIEAPKKHHPYAARAREALSAITLGKLATLRCKPTEGDQQQACSVWVAPASAPDGPRTLDAGLAMTTLGMARWQRAHAAALSPQERGQYEFAEQEAKAKRAGLWSDATPLAPRD